MTLIIAILLALILVALVSSSEGAALGVKKAFKYTAVTSIVLTIWLLFIAALLWIGSLDDSTTSVGYVALLAVGILTPAALVWSNLSEIRQAFSEDPKKATKRTTVICGYGVLFLIVMAVAQLLKKEGLDTFVVLITAIVAGSVLIGRSRYRWHAWREVWVSPKEPENIFRAMQSARARADEENQLLWENDTRNWEQKSPEEQAALSALHVERLKQSSHQLELSRIALEAEHAAWRKRGFLSVRYVFWMSVAYLVITAARVLWNSYFNTAPL